MRPTLALALSCCLLGLTGCPCGSISGQMSDGRAVSGIEVCGDIDGTFALFDANDPNEFDLFFAPEVTGSSELRVDVNALGMMIPISYAQMTDGATPDLGAYPPYENGGLAYTSAEIEVLSAEVVLHQDIEFFRTRLRWDVEYGEDDGSGLYLHLTGTDWVETVFLVY